MVAVWFALQLGLAAGAVLTAEVGGARRGGPALLLGAGFALPWFAPLAPVAVVFLTFISIIALLKTTQIATTRGSWPPSRRVWHLFGVADVRGARLVKPVMDWKALATVVVCGALCNTAGLLMIELAPVGGTESVTARALSAAVVFLAGFGALANLVHFSYLALGIEVPPMQRAPLLSRNLGEFWGKRWNTVVGDWLHDLVFRPLAKRWNPKLALAATFGASAAIHAWLIFALGTTAAMMMAAYFLLQGAAVLVEQRIGVRRAPALIARLWTVFVLLVPFPLLFDPFARALGM